MMFRAVFWVILPCKMIVDRRFRGAYCLHHHDGSITQKTALNRAERLLDNRVLRKASGHKREEVAGE
jgi:hypothetical protein